MLSEEFTLPSGEVVTLRGLSGFEVMLSKKKYGDDLIGQNAFMFAAAMGVSEPAALEWLKEHSAGDFVAATEKVQELSGMSEGAGKSVLS